MSDTRKATVSVKGTEVTVLAHREQDCISLTDIARHKNAGLTDDRSAIGSVTVTRSSFSASGRGSTTRV